MIEELVQYQLLIRVVNRCPELGFKTSGVVPQSYIALYLKKNKNKNGNLKYLFDFLKVTLFPTQLIQPWD